MRHVFRTLSPRWIGILALACWVLPGCDNVWSPPNPPNLDNPPCLTDNVSPQSGATIPREGVKFRVVFSKLMEPTTISEETIYLVREEMDISFLRNLESTSAVTESRLPRLVPLKIEATEIDSEGKQVTQLVIEPLTALRGDTLYELVLTRRLRDKLVELTENRRTGSRPLNRCADSSGVWSGSVDEYRSGYSQRLQFTTEPEPPRPGTPRIVEVMASPPTGKAEYVEIQNVHPSENLDLCGLLLSDGSTAREISAISGGNCTPVGPGKRAVIIEPDYDIKGNPYGIPPGAVILTTKGSSTTLLSGGLSSGEPIQLLQGDDLLEQISPSSVAGGVWPSGKSLEKCDAKGANQPNNWGESGDASGGTPGKANNASCTD